VHEQEQAIHTSVHHLSRFRSLIPIYRSCFSPLVFSSPHVPDVKPDDRHVQEHLKVPEIKSSHMSPAEEPQRPQSQQALHQRRLLRHCQNHPRLASRPLPTHSCTIAHVCNRWWKRPRCHSLKTLALSAPPPPALAQDDPEFSQLCHHRSRFRP